MFVPILRVVCCLVSGVYSCLNIYILWTKQRDVKSILSSSDGGVGYNIYIRLFTLSGIDLLIAVPYNLFDVSTWFPLSRWPGWTAAHAHWSNIAIITTSDIQQSSAAMVQSEFFRWIYVAYGIAFLVVFAGGAKSRIRYASAWQLISKKFRQSGSNKNKKSSRNLPMLSFAKNKHSASDKSDASGLQVISEITVMTTTSTLLDTVISEGEGDYYVESTEKLPKPSGPTDSQQYRIPRISPPSTPPGPDLESGIGM